MENTYILSMINKLPHELWESILMNFNYNKIEILCSKYSQIDEYCKNNNIREKIKYKNYPRSSGHCGAHDVSSFSNLIHELKKIDINKLDISEQDDLIKLNEILDKTLKLLYEKNTELIYGDLVCFNGLNNLYNDGIFIFNGYKIIPLDNISRYKALPKEFVILNNDVPINYWSHETEIHNSGEVVTKLRGIKFNSIVWLNIEKLKDQCINNIKIEDNVVFTSFIHNNKTYYIYYSPNEVYFSDNENYMELLDQEKMFKNILGNEDILMLEYDDFFYLLPEKRENALFFNKQLYYQTGIKKSYCKPKSTFTFTF